MVVLGLAACHEPEPAVDPYPGVIDLRGQAIDPFATDRWPTVLVFVTPDCPISNRYAPELRRLAQAHPGAWWLVYPDPDLTSAAIERHRREFGLDLPALVDPRHTLVALAEAVVTPEAAVFVAGPRRVYRGRIDDRVPEFGKARPEPEVRDLDLALAAIAAGDDPPTASTRAVGCPIGDLR